MSAHSFGFSCDLAVCINVRKGVHDVWGELYLTLSEYMMQGDKTDVSMVKLPDAMTDDGFSSPLQPV